MKKKSKGLPLLIAVLLLSAGILGGLNYFGTFLYNNVADSSVDIYLSRDMSGEQMLEAVAESGAIDNTVTFRRAVRHLGKAEDFKPGHYRLRGGMGNKAIIRTLAFGWQAPVNVTFTGYFRSLDRLAGHISRQLEADSASFAAAFNDPATIAGYGFKPATFIAMFIPNTYEVYWTLTPEDFIERMHREYEKFWTEERQYKAAAAGLSQTEVSTLASIVSEETKYVPEMPVIAGVYINRLRKGMPLQADPTVKFAAGDESLRRILNTHLAIDSPYNTYKYAGLPPGPICMTPISALDAVLNYSRHNYLYFCAKSTLDGQHEFASTLSQHNNNARAYHLAISRQKRGKLRTNS